MTSIGVMFPAMMQSLDCQSIALLDSQQLKTDPACALEEPQCASTWEMTHPFSFFLRAFTTSLTPRRMHFEEAARVGNIVPCSSWHLRQDKIELSIMILICKFTPFLTSFKLFPASFSPAKGLAMIEMPCDSRSSAMSIACRGLWLTRYFWHEKIFNGMNPRNSIHLLIVQIGVIRVQMVGGTSGCVSFCLHSRSNTAAHGVKRIYKLQGDKMIYHLRKVSL